MCTSFVTFEYIYTYSNFKDEMKYGVALYSIFYYVTFH